MEKEIKIVLKKISDKKFQNDSIAYGSPVVVFWGVTLCAQRIFGIAKYYSGKWQGSGMIGMLAVGASICVTQKVCFEYIYPNLPEIPILLKEQYFMGNVFLAMGIYALSDLNMFQTIFPSSILSTGSYARGRNFRGWANMSVPTDSAKASAKSKISVNRLGRIFGCHHCGNRQLLGWKGFIADHMPPTKIANDMNNIFWRRWFGIKVSQSLWPQCFDCFQMQGSAVRAGDHKMVYHYRFRVHHMSLLFAILLQQQPMVRQALSDVEANYNAASQFVESSLRSMIPK